MGVWALMLYTYSLWQQAHNIILGRKSSTEECLYALYRKKERYRERIINNIPMVRVARSIHIPMRLCGYMFQGKFGSVVQMWVTLVNLESVKKRTWNVFKTPLTAKSQVLLHKYVAENMKINFSWKGVEVKSVTTMYRVEPRCFKATTLHHTLKRWV